MASSPLNNRNYPPNSKKKGFLRFFSLVYSTCVLSLFFSVADQALGHAGHLPLNATLLCLILLAPFSALGLIRSVVSSYGTSPLRLLFDNRHVITSFFVIVLSALTLSGLNTAYWGEGGKWIAIIPYGLCVTVTSIPVGANFQIRSALPLISIFSLIILATSIWYDTLHPGTFADPLNRAAGFPGNANFAALVAVLISSASLNFGDIDKPYDYPNHPASPKTQIPRIQTLLFNALNLLTTFAIIVMTMSRSGLLNFATLLVTFIFFRYVRSPLPIGSKFKEVSALVICAIIALGFVFTYTELTSVNGGNSRLSRLLNNQRVDDGSAGTRLGAIVDCLEHIEAAPILGHGTGFSRTMSELPHNIYLQQWVNNGILGIVSYIALLITALATFMQRGCRNGQALILVAVVGGLFSHNLLDQRPFLMLLGIMLGASVISQPSQDNLLSLIPLHNAAKQRPLPERFSASSKT